MNLPQNKIPPPVIAICIGLLMWSLSSFIPIISLNPTLFTYLGIFFITIGLCLDVVSLFKFYKSKTTVSPISPDKATTLVIGGFYRFTRNPMYLGLLLVLMGIACLFASLSPFLLLPLFVSLMNGLQIKSEERALEKLFSAQYVNYKKKVRRWL